MPALLSTTEAAERLEVSPRVVALWCSQGKLKAVLVGKTWAIDERDLKGFEKPKRGRPKQ